MTPLFTPCNQAAWRTIDYLGEFALTLPEPLASWDVWCYWESERVNSMRSHLKQDMVLYDIGTEHGWCNLVYARFVGAQNMVLVEPTAEFWPNIRETWIRNYPVPPRACYDGLLGTVTDDHRTDFTDWPASSIGSLINATKYEYLHCHSAAVRQTTLDELVARTGAVPDALTIDVEGAELEVLRGAEETLRDHRPLVWVSIHPDLMERDYGVTPGWLHAFMRRHGYTGEHLATDHECHWLFAP